MRRFVKRVSVFLGILISILGGIIIVSNLMIDKKDNFEISKETQYLVLGHSHTEGAFNDSLILNAKNMARGGEHYFFTYLKAKKILESNSNVKAVFLELTNNHISSDVAGWINNSEKNMTNIPAFSPAMDFSDHRYVFRQNPYAYIRSQEIVIKNNLNFLLYRKKNILLQRDWGGFYANPRQKVDSLLKNNQKKIVKDKSTEDDFDDSNLIFIDKIRIICKKRGVRLFLIRSPQHPKYTGAKNESKLKEIIKKRYSEIPYLDFNNFLLANGEYADLDHLNFKGAQKFSVFFNSLVKDGLLESNDPEKTIQEKIYGYK
jgi:hypothetical protein